MKKIITTIGLLLLSFWVNTSWAETARIDDLRIELHEQNQHQHQVELILAGEHLSATDQIYHADHQWVMDFPDAISMLNQELFTFDATMGIQRVLVGAGDGRVRLVVFLEDHFDLEPAITTTEHEMRIVFQYQQPQQPIKQAEIEQVSFKQTLAYAEIAIQSSTTLPLYEKRKQDNQVWVELNNIQLASGQQRSQDLTAFASIVAKIDSYQADKNVRVVLHLREQAEVEFIENGTQLFIRVKKAIPKIEPVVEKEVERVPYLSYHNADIMTVISKLAEMNHFNIVMDEGISRKITLTLKDVTWEEALSVVLKSSGLGQERIGDNIIRIAPIEVIEKAIADRATKEAEARAVAEAEAQQEVAQEEQLEPLVTRYFKLKFADVVTIQEMMNPTTATGTGTTSATTATAATAATAAAPTTSNNGGGMKMLSSRGSLMVDKTNNQFIITDTESALDKFQRFLDQVDLPVKQILIEARIVEANDSFSRDIGVRWGATPLNGGAIPAIATPRGVQVDLPAGGNLTGTLFGHIASPINLNLELSAAEADGKIKVVSSPRVITNNHEQATIEQTDAIPYTQTTYAGGVATTSTISKDAKLLLTVTPTIFNGKVMMEVVVNKDTPRINEFGGDPIINRKSVTTKLIVENNGTIVLGGIYSESKNNSEGGVPLLKELPLLGHLFKTTKETNQRTELLVFLTPKIIEQP
ncbi:MAG: type IV pilus secretin PilQ [Zetaproteobacteria bacterium]|nr:type IV pilus secretin PilQ [Zetaproteobacteria bacterium]